MKNDVFKIYLRFLSIAYLVGFLIHFADILDLRLAFSKMDNLWQIWTIYLAVFDVSAAYGLWRQKVWGIYLFLIVAVSQLIVYLIFADKFGHQYFLIAFHLVTIAIFSIFIIKRKK